MKHYLDLIPISAQVHKKQNRMSVFCIVLAVFLVTAIFGMADMFIRSQILKAQQEDGNWHINIKNLSDENAKIIAARSNVKASSFYGVLNFRGNDGYTIAGKEAVICGSDESFLTEIFPGMLIEGTFPKTDREALVTYNAKEMIGLNIGEQISVTTSSGSELKFTVTGFAENSSNLMSSDGYGMCLSTETYRAIYTDLKEENTDNYNSVFFVQFADTSNLHKEISDLKSDFALTDENISENTKLLGLLGQSRNSFMLQIYLAAAVLFVLVLLAGIMMIASSLNSNVAQRIEFYGLIRCIGATPKQVMKLVRKEALSWCRFAIPIGVALGIVVIWILCFILRYLSPDYFGAMPGLIISIPSIISGIVTGLMTVLLAARSPAKKAAKVSPLAAVSGNASDLQPIKKAANTKLFKIDMALGIHHAKASRKNFILMVSSFSLSIILFLSFSVTISFMNHSLTPLYPWQPDVSIISPDNTCTVDRDFIEKLKENPIVKSVYGRMFAYDMAVTINNLEKKIDFISYEKNQFDWAKNYLKDGSLETVQHEKNTGLIVYEPRNTIEVGDTVIINIDNQSTEIKIVGMLSASPFNNAADVGTIICSEDTFRNLTGESDYTIIDMQLTKDASDADVNTIHRTFGEGYKFVDERMNNSSILGVYYCVWLFLYGFLVLIALITIFNVINSIALSSAAHTKQYGTFRAIGLSSRQLSKMIIAEAATYTAVGGVVGTILGLICNRWIFGLLISYKWGDTWTFPIIELTVILLIVVLSVIMAVHGPIKKIHNMSIVDTISAQ